MGGHLADGYKRIQRPGKTSGWYGYGMLEIFGGFGVRKLSAIHVDRIAMRNARPSKIRWPDVLWYRRALYTPSLVTSFPSALPLSGLQAAHAGSPTAHILSPSLPPRRHHSGGTEFPQSL